MRLCKLKSILIFMVFQWGMLVSIFAQHYIFIEAEGQQPFYLKRAGQTSSSTASGFIILSKVTASEIDFIIGFPNKLYPEVAFKINNLQADRGFYLKQLEGKGWVLVDRETSSVLLGGKVDVQQAQAIAYSSTGFAELLADATGDKSLLDKTYLVNAIDKSTAAKATENTKPKTSPTVTKQDNAQRQVKKLSSLGTIRSYIQSEDSSLLKIAYFDKGIKANWDTIYVEIERFISKPIQQLALVNPDAETTKLDRGLSGSTILSISSQPTNDNKVQLDCIHPIAMPKDVRELQRRLSRASSLEDQMGLAEKAFNEKCFTTKQVKELGTFFWEEETRLVFFSRVQQYVSDPSLYSELEQSFLQDSSKKAFREMLKKQSL
jgi:hypothetical protein